VDIPNPLLLIVCAPFKINGMNVTVGLSSVLALFLCFNGQVIGQQHVPVLDNERVADLVRGGMGQEELLRAVATAPVVAFRFLPGDMSELLKAGVSQGTIKAMAARHYGRPMLFSPPAVDTAADKLVLWEQTNPACGDTYDAGGHYRSFTGRGIQIKAKMSKDLHGVYADVVVTNRSDSSTPLNILPGQFTLQRVAKGKILTARDMQKETSSGRKWYARGTARESSVDTPYLKAQTVVTGRTVAGLVAFHKSKAGAYVLRYDAGQVRIDIPFEIH
jgi:hypothetical protein